MHAVTQDRYGSADVLEFRTVDRPATAANDVLIEVHAAGVDRGTWHLMTGTPYLIRLMGFGLTKPKNRIAGADVAGQVVAVGADVTRFAPGDNVFGIANGSFAEYTAASEDKLAHKPANVSFEQAAVATVSGITALQALTDVGKVQPGQRVLIIGGSGGVGTFAVQLAKAIGAEVTAVASTPNLDLLRSIGADQVIDYTQDDFTDTNTPYHLILDIGGRTKVSRLRRALAPRGTLVIVGGEGGNRVTGGIGRQLGAVLVSPFVKQRLTMFIAKEHYSFIERLGAYLNTKQVIPTIGRRFALADTRQALHEMEAGRASAKSVIIVRDDGADEA
ncbi:MAG: NAD(P)-dependent alcohol dehydrogenase [Actinomycetia bacterium]|nr:NAD(P)-dependent alcohol dehydrogenase [Actinomycetes bacterium]